MPIIVFGNSNTKKSGNKIDTSLFVQKLYLRTNCIENKIEEDIDLKFQFRIKNLPDPISIREPASRNDADNKFNDPSKIKSFAQVDFIDERLNKVRFFKVNSKPTLQEQLTPKIYVGPAISHGVFISSLLKLDPGEKLNLNEQDSIILNSTLTTPKTIIELPTKSYVDIRWIDPSITRKFFHVVLKIRILINSDLLK